MGGLPLTLNEETLNPKTQKPRGGGKGGQPGRAGQGSGGEGGAGGGQAGRGGQVGGGQGGGGRVLSMGESMPLILLAVTAPGSQA